MDAEKYTLDLPLAISYRGNMVLGISEFLTVYFGGAHTPEIKEGVVACLTRYIDAYGRHLRFATDFPNKRWLFYGPETVRSISNYILSAEPDDAWQFRIHGGASSEAASYFKIEALGFRDWQSEQGDYLSFLKMQLPVLWIEEHPEDLVELFRLACEKVRPVQGWGGLGFALPEDLNDQRRMEHWVYQLAQKFPLLEVEDPVFDQSELSKGIRGGNWLTAVGEPWLLKLGGIEELAKNLGDLFSVQPYPGGAMIRAGKTYGVIDPLLSAKDVKQLTSDDVRQIAIPPHYRKLAHVLKPVRISEFPAIHSCQYGRPCFDEPSTLAWLKRFD